MGYVYHGSKIQGLDKIEKKVSTHGKEWVYATPSKAVATVFMSNGGSDLKYYLAGRGTEDRPLILVERKCGMFDEIYNLSGSLYTLSDEHFQSNRTGWSAEVISEYDEPVLYEEHIDNVLDKITKLAGQGELELYRYPNRPAYIPLDNSDLIPKVINAYKSGKVGFFNRFLDIYPELADATYAQLEEKDEVKTL